MKRFSVIVLALVALSAQTGTGWVTLFDGKNLDSFNQVGNANWQLVDGVVHASSGAGFLVSKDTYTDFELKVEFWSSNGGNSGVYMRCLDGSKITDKTCYEANIFDKRPDQSGRTGGIPNYAPPIAIVDAEGKWNTYEITMRGPQIIVVLNGTKTVDAKDPTLKSGPIALQYMAGDIKFRNVQIRKL
ncbi:MAG TPA: DUF1080 domain-containing protein [Vicinamibacterales bacterium]|nr:DUF1080 domain-containing protein [Vicinamibacterales bacterium]